METADAQGAGKGAERVSAEEMGKAADALFYAMRAARSASAAGDGGLSLAQLAVLEPLADEGEVPVGRLARAAGVSVPTVTRMVKQLEARGVVVRRRSSQDERQVLVRLTASGAALLADVVAHRRARQARAYEAFTPEERAQLVRLLPRLAALIEQG
ncbi:MarR family transcriptional regulator [Streptomyces sp. NPDC046939]|uniref:MarR family winged helix-turn-helix transcriptional regulator n=1 Tax=Streptomyces sp. NPDC046939 TaxID=3155376 RepID=UPI0033C4C60E